MRSCILIVLALFTITFTAQAQELESGSTALMFEIAGFGQFGLSGSMAGSTTLLPLSVPQDSVFEDLLSGTLFPIYGIGVKAFVTDNFAIRGVLGLNYSSETTRTPGVDSTGNPVTIERTDNMFVGAVSPGFEYHFPMAGPVSGYVGGMISYTSGVKTTGPDDAQTSNSSSSFLLGPILGAEFLPWDNFSLGAEYFLAFSSTSTSTKIGDASTDGPSYTNIGTGNFAVRASLYIK